MGASSCISCTEVNELSLHRFHTLAEPFVTGFPSIPGLTPEIPLGEHEKRVRREIVKNLKQNLPLLRICHHID